MRYPFIIAALLGGALGAWTAEPAEEYHVKGAYLLNFVKFVDWPQQVFKGPEDAINICILGPNPFGPGLDRAARDLMVANRPVNVRAIADAQHANHCQVAFVSGSERKLTRQLLEAVGDGNVLTVGESDGFTASGGVIGFKLDGEKVRIEINTAAADKAKLRISAKLLSLAQSAKR